MGDERDQARDATRTGARPSQAPTRAGDLQPGELIHETYRLDKLIARGGMGAVYKATNVHTGDTVAVKVVRADLAGDDMIRELFRREAMALRKVRHPAVVAYEGVLGDADGRLYLVMEYVDGPSLGSLTSKAPLSPSEVRRLGRALAEGLAAAHDQGVVHRDLAPDNVVLRGGRLDQPVLIDFGLAKRTDSGASSVIGSAFAGKLDYCSPEQCGLFGGQVDARTDIYSLGLTLAAAAAGRAVPMGSSLAYAVKAREHEPDLASVPDELRADLMPLLQPDPARRVQNMRDVFVTVPTRVSNSESLIRSGARVAAGSAPPSGSYAPSGSYPPSGPPAPSVAPSPPAAGGRGVGRPAAIAAAVALLLLAGGGGAYWLTRPPATVATTVNKEDPEAAARARAAEEKRLADARRADEQARARIERERIAADAARAEAERARAAEAAKADQSKAESARAEAARAEAARAEAARAETAKAEAAKAEAAKAEAARAEAAKAETAKAEAAKAEAAKAELAKAEAAKAEAARAEAARVEADLRTAERARSTTEEAARRQTEQEARERAAAEEAAARFGEAERKRAQAALTGIGHDTGGIDGSFGPRSRQMIGDWQRANGRPATGYLTRPQYDALQRAAAGPLARYDAEQRRLEEEAKRRAAEMPTRPPEPAGRTPATTTTTAAATPGQVPANWAGQVCVTGSSTSTGCGPARLTMSGGRGSGDWNFKGVKLSIQVSINLDATGSA
ncbi:MAG: protein kinase, partial [Rhodospirillales bacterium]|nr:protein kinase [Rhodospirillales bacterium]